VPCPISERAMRIMQVSSGFTTTQALTSVPPVALCALAVSGSNGRCMPSARPPPAAAVPTTNLRRETLREAVFSIVCCVLFFMVTSSTPTLDHELGRVGALGLSRRDVDGGADALVGAA